MSSRTRSASVSRVSSSTSSNRPSSVSARSTNVLATVHSPEVNRSVVSTSADQSRFPHLSASLDNNIVTTDVTSNVPPLLSDSSPGANLSSQLDSATTSSLSTSSSSHNSSSSSRDNFSSP